MVSTLPNIHDLKIKKYFQTNNLENKAEYEKSINVLDKDRVNIVNTNSWMPFFVRLTWYVMLMF